MESLSQDFNQFAATLLGHPATAGGSAAPLARELTQGYLADPKFWLHYALVCLDRKDFSEGSRALARIEELVAEQERTESGPLGRGATFAALRFLALKYRIEMLKVVALGNPSIQAELLQGIRRLHDFRLEDLKRDLAAAGPRANAAVDSGATAERRWAMHLGRLEKILQPLSHAPDLDLARGLMGAGRYVEAVRWLQEPPAADDPAPGTRDARRWHRLLLDWLSAFLQDPLGRIAPFSALENRYVLPIVVWGDSYLDTLERITLPSFLAEGNLPYLREVGEPRIIFFTTAEGGRRLRQMEVFQEIARSVHPDIVTFPGDLANNPNPYQLMTAMHLAGLEIAKAGQAHFIFVAPDLVFSDNFMRTVEQRRRRGAEVVFVPGLILELESFHEEQARRFPAVRRVLSIAPRELLELGLRHVHPFVQRAYTYTPNGRRSTVAVFLWPLANGGYVVHGFHHTPFLISAPAVARFDGSMFTQIDGDFLPRILRSRAELDRCVMITDPAETTFFELSGRNRFGASSGSDLGGFDGGEFDLGHLCRFGALLGRVAQWLLPQKACFDPTGTGIQDPAWSASDRVVEELLRGMEQVERAATHLPIGGSARSETDEGCDA